jgi:GTPase
LEQVVKTRELHRASRRKVPFPLVALVGYTNAGKSTLFNRMTGADVLAKDMLFATLDPTMRGIVLPEVEGRQGRKIIASDTVGFISDLPTQLVAAFRATLEEVLEADRDPARARHLASGKR